MAGARGQTARMSKLKCGTAYRKLAHSAGWEQIVRAWRRSSLACDKSIDNSPTRQQQSVKWKVLEVHIDCVNVHVQIVTRQAAADMRLSKHRYSCQQWVRAQHSRRRPCSSG